MEAQVASYCALLRISIFYIIFMDHHDQYHRHHHHYRDGGLGYQGIHIVVIIRITFIFIINNLIETDDMIVKLAALLCIFLCLEY